jgi:hypothetical protein
VPALSHGSLTLDLPNEWADRSTLMFAAPEGADHGSISLTVNRIEAESAASVLKRTFAELERVVEKARLVTQGELQCGLGKGAFYDVAFELAEVPMRQILGVVMRGGLAYRLTASVVAERFDAQAPRLWEILRSVRVG